MDQPETQSMEDRLAAAEKRIAAVEAEVRDTQATANFNRGEISDLRGQLAQLSQPLSFEPAEVQPIVAGKLSGRSGQHSRDLESQSMEDRLDDSEFRLDLAEIGAEDAETEARAAKAMAVHSHGEIIKLREAPRAA